ncbi:MAG TPA: excinuclease ABC subunit UvrA [Patescibacteria group bacterium]|uniref:UvrABC system protein A n=1 Tax=Candidatus Woesebacteria bacterium RBG_13_46_13 TaxID=1802479 RepID=A0A1F7X3R8_9BACT|nr:MAG: excinuclease ABC subunit A [Candidatus Woesebacteria bacterium RBG_13_46_13]HJX59625.1 excinuclease ABC subunit UvrA [Patescibacteria group bacterium]
MENTIRIRGARQHNLKNINLEIPKNKLVVLTGVSGSGKSSLAFDTLYAEGQRRYVESLSTYARQFLGIMEKPDVDHIEGLSPAISIDQKTTSRNPRSTVGTVTEVYDYLRLLFARIGHPHCPVCGREISHQSIDQIVEQSFSLISEETKKGKVGRFMILSPVVSDRKGEFSSLFDNLKAKGYKQLRVDGYIKDLSEDFVLIKTNKHTIEVVIDKLSLSLGNIRDKVFIDNLRSRLADSFQQALNLSEGNAVLAQIKDVGFEMPEYPKKFENHLFSEKFACPTDNIQIPEIEPRTFSFNSPHGACPSCSGLGKILKVEPSFIFAPEISITEGAILPFATMFEHDTWVSRLYLEVCKENGIDPKTPIKNLSSDEIDILLYGTGDFEYMVEGTNRWGRFTRIYERFIGIVADLERRYRESTSDYVKGEIEKYMREQLCATCKGSRLKPESLSVTILSQSISALTSNSVSKTLEWVNSLNLNTQVSAREKEIAKLIIKEIEQRLKFLISVGLEYLTLDREAGSLSGGEAQRIRLASQIGSGLTGVLYVLDEPTIGLHQRDNKKLIDTLKRLRDLGNTVVVVEHDREMIGSADHVIDFGPGAGEDGGEIVATGTAKQISANPKSLTGKFMSGKRRIDILKTQSLLKNPVSLSVFGASQFNLKGIDVDFPLGKLVCITGVSGSGKSTLLVETLFPALSSYLNPLYRGNVGKFIRLEGKENIDKVILIDQSPIGRTPRSNPATYTGVFDPVREVFANTREARAMGFKKGRFSFNLRGGRCEACEGQGQIKIEMQFMSDIWITCDVCGGKRYSSQTLEVSYRGKNIAEVLAMTVNDSLEFFHSHPKILAKLETLEHVGLGYMKLGQPATTLSGGEAQRVKLATELSKRATGKTVYILDEPTTGLHFADVERLLKVLRLLVDKGNSVFLIEHNLDVIKNADWIIDLGPEGGEDGGNVVAKGTVVDIKKNDGSYTGKFLQESPYK